MPRKSTKTVYIRPSLFDPGGLPTPDQDCAALSESDDGCPACQDEYDEVTDMAIQEQKCVGYKVWDVMLADPSKSPTMFSNRWPKTR